MRLPEALFAARTMQALEALAMQSLSAPQVAAALQIHPRTARRLLNRLCEEGYVSRSEDVRRLYSPTMRLVAMAGHVVERAELPLRAAPHVQRLHDDVGGVAHLMVPSYTSALCLVHGANGCPAKPRLRELVPSHCTAPGKALLGHRDAWRESVLARELGAWTPRTLTDPDALRAEARAIRAQGFAIEDGEYAPDARAVAAPVFAGGDAVAAIGAVVPDGASLDDVVARVVAAAGDVTSELGSGPDG